MQLFCSWCGSGKPEHEFVKRKASEPYSQKNVRCCRECNLARNKERFHTDPEVHRKQAEATKRWAKKNPESVRLSHQRYCDKHDVKRKAKDAVKHEIRMGRIVREPCEVCGMTTKIEGHHDSYEPARWLDVRWLCRDHHKAWHSILDPLKAEGEGKKVIDQVFKEFMVHRRSTPPT
jgi:hypothetical protein